MCGHDACSCLIEKDEIRTHVHKKGLDFDPFEAKCPECGHLASKHLPSAHVFAKYIMDSLNKLSLAVEEIKESLPPDLTQEVITASGACCSPATVKKLFDTLGMNTAPLVQEHKYHLPPEAQENNEWSFTWTWSGENVLEKNAYPALLKFVNKHGPCEIVDNGQRLGSDGLLYNESIFTARNNPMIPGQRPRFRHIVRGRTDLVMLDRPLIKGEMVLRNMVKFAVEVKTKKSISNGTPEAMVQLIGLNVCNPKRSPPVILTNVVRSHSVFYVHRVSENPLSFQIRKQPCNSFPAAVHFALGLCDNESVTSELSRGPSRPPSR